MNLLTINLRHIGYDSTNLFLVMTLLYFFISQAMTLKSEIFPLLTKLIKCLVDSFF